MIEDDPHPIKEDLVEGLYCLVRYTSKKSISYFVGITQSKVEETDTLTVKFMTRLPSKNGTLAFVLPTEDDIDDVHFNNIILVLPPPVSSGGTKRMASRLVFNSIDLSGYF